MSFEAPAELNETSRRVFTAIRRHCALAWPIMKTQCGLAGVDPAGLAPGDLERVVPRVAEAMARFTSEAKAQTLRDELLGPAHEPARSATAAAAPTHDGSRTVGPQVIARGDLSRRVFDLLQSASPLASPLFESQCQRAGFDANHIRADQLLAVLPHVRRALARFSSESRAESVVEQLRSIAIA